MFEWTRRGSVFQVSNSNARWLSTGWNGGFSDAGAAYNISVPEGWDRTDLDSYISEQQHAHSFSTAGPALLTGVNLSHLRGARSDPITVFVTAGMSNPAALSMTTSEGTSVSSQPSHQGTVNIIVCSDQPLTDAGMTTLLSVIAEAKATTLLHLTGFPGTTTDAIIVGTDQRGSKEPFAGSSTSVGQATRICVRDAIKASLDSRSAEAPDSVAEAEYGVITTGNADVFQL
ncbi:adenosylcobinamide amidohydrolase [Salinarchaeum sp. IM2453]|uniref:adenosylcobinamide amidohydrolase n=1 Tax=Salinarchaeum sp. IM2453 TaxID=2862870 RepID=UPI001C833176|nr:adenosylcobinamide amidohydrolase [Salinarchaeum sp. IM2453]QZA87631.1 adenosylcobinamide amidohydrolase [Salinarchaeum sp. IM2453]